MFAFTNQLKNENDGWIGDLVDRAVLEKMLYCFSKSTALKATLVDTEGNTLISTDEVQDCRFCKMIHSDPKGVEKCRRSYARACKDAAKYGEPYIFRCHAGLIMWAAPIVIDDNTASIICGQVLMWEPEDYFLDEIEEMVKGLNVDISAVKWSAAQLEVMSGDKVQAAADLLHIVANQIMKTGRTVLEQRQQIAAQQAQLAEEIQARKKAELAIETIDSRTVSIYSLDKEQEIKAKVRNSERDDAQRILDELLIDFMEKSNDIKSLKCRVGELVVIISRSALQGGADPNKVFNYNSKYFTELTQITKFDEICLWAKEVLNAYLDTLDDSRDSRNFQSIQKAADYIKENSYRKITIDEIAQVVYLSPCYLSRIFKQSLGCTLMEYLTQVRVEKAKHMLKNPKYNITQVAEESGFGDPGYFTRVFKKIEGITPSRYKQNAL